MQVIRMARKGKPRSFYQKVIEMILATRMELSFSKDKILQYYTSHAPFGGNVVGLEAASWRYYQKHPSKLSIAEAAMLAVLPNAPSLIHLSRNRKRLLEKRNMLLLKMKNGGFLTAIDYELSLIEKIPDAPYRLPSLTPHLLEYVHKKFPQKIMLSTIDSDIQKTIIDIGNYHHKINSQSDIQNLSILIMDTKSGSVKGYLGNAPKTSKEKSVDMIHAYRSSGSILKPFLYAHMLDEGKMMPNQLVKDVPTYINGYQPKNYNRKYTGATPVDNALAMSLNVPAVHELRSYGVEPFIKRLNNHGFKSINKSADHYGLSLILGGGEVSLWDLCSAYATMGRILIRYNSDNSQYNNADIHGPKIVAKTYPESDQFSSSLLSAGAIYKTFEAMLKVLRPGSDGEWEKFYSSKKIAWKTGTSYGHKDAWAIGVSKDYTIGVWVGNADGEGKHGLVGVSKAGPILFDVFNRLDGDSFFEKPSDDLLPMRVCHQSGYITSQYCVDIDTVFTVEQGQKTSPCPYHRLIHVNNDGYQVTDKCISPFRNDSYWMVRITTNNGILL